MENEYKIGDIVLGYPWGPDNSNLPYLILLIETSMNGTFFAITVRGKCDYKMLEEMIEKGDLSIAATNKKFDFCWGFNDPAHDFKGVIKKKITHEPDLLKAVKLLLSLHVIFSSCGLVSSL